MKIESLIPRDIFFENLSPEIQKNLTNLAANGTQLEQWIGFELMIDRGFSTLQHHLEIYARKNALLKSLGKNPVPIPMHSAHLSGNAFDVADPSGKIEEWLHWNDRMLMGRFWMEELSYTRLFKYIHFQQIAPASGNLYFQPW